MPASVETPAYDRAASKLGVVHFGPGAFHRAHQAWYFDEMLKAGGDFAVCGVAVRSADVEAALRPQDGLYALAEREAEPRLRIIGSIREVLTAPRAPETVLARLADPGVRLVTSTVTEKGYCLTPAGDLDLGHPDIRRDLEGAGPPVSFPGWLATGLAARRAGGVAPFVALSCDNLSDNGKRLRRAVLQLVEAKGDRDLAAWIEGEVRFPSTMVDSITPATDDELREKVRRELGLEDAWPIQRERFVQWVVEDALGADADAFAAAGVTLTHDVAAFEKAKLRLLNGAHSTLAYVGLRLGHETVAQAMGDDALAGFVARMMREDIAASLPPTPGLDTAASIAAVLIRFRNPAIAHRLAQIAWDGSHKLPFRILETTAEALAEGRPVSRLAVPVAAWMHFVRARARAGEAITDPMADTLLDLGRRMTGDPAADVAPVLALAAVFPPAVAANARFRRALETAYAQLDTDPSAALAA
ncbi:mannitol dehydrogenase family protein [Phenylobacterium sp. J367]|uniref:mannitol dehydrogenase family protein n=1 Tax=Phenylobacterium sp. J367 TaxID=2898435 RepID=UPI0021514DB8|nr:mannitol dehydrogenase family protein [Phenylobacterium sp. J367]MCR5880924.1 mannitol dehydrogenase family protein [Phenylobacterium sp. J367]